MKAQTVAFLLNLNRQFYQNFGLAFAVTRRRLQPGMQRILNQLARVGNWLDLGCGNGALALEWARQGRQGLYFGLDFSSTLLEEARRAVAHLTLQGLDIRFAQADLANPDWPQALIDRGAWHLQDERLTTEGPVWVAAPYFDGILAFAVLHHLPGVELRQRVLRQARSLLSPGGQLILSVWQFQHSPRLMERRQPWEKVGLDPGELESGDTLLDWRHALPDQSEQVGLRYVHLFNRAELAALANDAGFEIVNEFESDGQGGRLGLYQTWQTI